MFKKNVHIHPAIWLLAASFLKVFILVNFIALIAHSAVGQEVIGQDNNRQEIDFAHQVVPLLQQHCVACHGGREAKGSFSLNTRELVVDSGHVEISQPQESYLIELVRSEDADVQMPPADRLRLTAVEQQLLADWIAAGLPWDDGFSFAPSSYEPPLKPRRPELPTGSIDRQHPIDRIIDAYWLENGVSPPPQIDDATFLRRVSLDLVGLIPDPETLQTFIADDAPNKRERVIDELLAEQIDYADHWLSFFNDLFRNDYSGTGFITGGRKQISGWLYESLLNNKPFDSMARELIAPKDASSQGYIDGIKWRGEVSAGQTNEIQFAQSISQSFLGINLKCASCHDSFIDRWTLDEAYGLAAIYSERPLEIHRCDKPIGRQATASWLFPELGQIDVQAPRKERLEQLAALMTHPENGRFSRTIVNRLWYKLMGRGIVHPLDAMQSEPWNEDLLDYLAVSLADHSYDLKSVLKLIATSKVYQSQTISLKEPPTIDYVFRGPLPRRLTAEQFLDNVWKITGAAPEKIDAPVQRLAINDTESLELTQSVDWIWGDSAAEGGVPPGGEKIALRTSFQLEDKAIRGGAVITCDNLYELYLNGNQISKGDDWTQPQVVFIDSFRPHLRIGNNELVLIVTNQGSGPNPAGLYFAAKFLVANHSELTVTSNDSWEFNPQLPVFNNSQLSKLGNDGELNGQWKAVTVVSPVPSWSETMTAQGPKLFAVATGGPQPMVRASLVKNDFLMKSLGRPSREQIVSMRPNELTTLEAIDLSNGASFADALAKGGRMLASRAQEDRSEFIRFIFLSTLCRTPNPAEMQAILNFLSPQPTADEIEDLLWTVFMMPEFMLVR